MIIAPIPEYERILVADRLLVGRDRLTNQPVLQVNGVPTTLNRIQQASWDQGGGDVFTKDQLERIYDTVDRYVPAAPMVENAFCATGPGGGVNDTCPPKGGGAKAHAPTNKDLLKPVTRGADKKWRYEGGKEVPAHIAKVGIPPAWKDVYVNPDPKGTVMAMGVDAKGRTQTKYSDTHNAKAAAAKFGRVTELRKKRAGIFKELEKDAKNSQLKDKAECLRVVMQTGMRPGSDHDTKADYKSYGATTLEGRHVIENKDGSVSLKLVTGKNKGREVEFPIHDAATAAMLKERAAKSGPDGKLFDVDAGKLRTYSKGKDGGGFKTKDHRTALGTETAVEHIKSVEAPTNLKEYKAKIKEVATKVASVLGNTPAMALKAYIDPQVFTMWRKKAGA
jgi:DNA topoisomerase-1